MYIGLYAICENIYNKHQVVLWALYITLSGALVFSLMKTTQRSELVPRFNNFEDSASELDIETFRKSNMSNAGLSFL